MPPARLIPSKADLPPGLGIEGHAIVSVDGMIAATDGTMPESLRNDADWRQFQAALDQSVLVALGRHGHERHPNPGRRRLVFTSRVAGIEADPDDPLSTFFNPAGASLTQVLDALALNEGTIAVTGGTLVFDYFRPVYTGFSLAEQHRVLLRRGRPCFPEAHPRCALAAAGLAPRKFELLDPAAGVSLTHWS